MLLAGSVDLEAVVGSLRVRRPVFHSEADLQHAFAWAAHELDPQLHVRLETHPEPDVRLDLLLSRPDMGRHTAVELKYLTAGWVGEVAGERFTLRNHGAQDVRTYDVVKDLARVERFVTARPRWDGLVLAMSNDPSYWSIPRHQRETNAQAFRIHEGNLLYGARAWGPRTGGTRKGREDDLTLKGSYRCAWTDYATLPGTRGAFRLIAFAVDVSAASR